MYAISKYINTYIYINIKITASIGMNQRIHSKMYVLHALSVQGHYQCAP